MRLSTHPNTIMLRVYKKYGAPDFYIVEFCEEKNLNDREEHYLSISEKDKYCCNINRTPYGARGIKRSLETRMKISKAKKGSKLSEEARKGCRERMYKRYANGYKVKPMIGELNGFYGKKHDEKTRAIMSRKKEGMYLGGNNPKARLVLNIETGIYYGSIVESFQSQSKYTMSSFCKQISNYRENKTPFIKV